MKMNFLIFLSSLFILGGQNSNATPDMNVDYVVGGLKVIGTILTPFSAVCELAPSCSGNSNRISRLMYKQAITFIQSGVASPDLQYFISIAILDQAGSFDQKVRVYAKWFEYMSLWGAQKKLGPALAQDLCQQNDCSKMDVIDLEYRLLRPEMDRIMPLIYGPSQYDFITREWLQQKFRQTSDSSERAKLKRLIGYYPRLFQH